MANRGGVNTETSTEFMIVSLVARVYQLTI